MIEAMNENAREDWLPALQQGEKTALSECFAEYRPRLERIAEFRLNRRLLARIDSDDVLQEAFMAASRRLPHCDTTSRETVFVWLRMILHQTLIDLHRQHLQAAGRDLQREVRADAIEPDTSGCIASQLVSQISSPSMSLKREELNERLRLALNQMEEKDREVLALRHFEELTNGEVARVLNLSVKAASIRYIRAMKKLKVLMESLPEWADHQK